MKPWDVAIVGGGILGTTLAYWLTSRFDARVAVYEQEEAVAAHASGRNTGVVHRPFYLHPERSRRFARSALLSRPLWERYARDRDLPWKEVGTLKLAVEEEQVPALDRYMRWGEANGLDEGELERLEASEVRALEPGVRCEGAVLAKREAAVDFGAFTRSLRADAQAEGARFLFGRRVTRLSAEGNVAHLHLEGDDQSHQAQHIVNCAGGGSVDLAHSMGVAMDLTDLHFRGEYWQVAPEHADLASRNLYSVPKHPEFPFLDPHWIVRASGEREIGPNAVPVAGPWTYRGFFESPSALASKAFEPPLPNKVRLIANPTFLRLAVEEGFGSLSKALLIGRVQRFLPSLRPRMLRRRGTAGVRSSLVDRQGEFVKEVMEVSGPHSTHILNYNSPGASGAPAYTASLLHRLLEAGALGALPERSPTKPTVWDWDRLAAQVA